MLNVLELKRFLSNIPDNAIVYVEADHGQSSEQAHSISASDKYFEDDEIPYYGEDISWKDISECDVNLINAVLISY